MKINTGWLNIPTGGRQTSWLFTSMTKELNWGLPRSNSRVRLEPVTSKFQVPHPNNLARCLRISLPQYITASVYHGLSHCVGYCTNSSVFIFMQLMVKDEYFWVIWLLHYSKTLKRELRVGWGVTWWLGGGIAKGVGHWADLSFFNHRSNNVKKGNWSSNMSLPMTPSKYFSHKLHRKFSCSYSHCSPQPQKIGD